MGTLLTEVELKYITKTNGEQSVIMTGTLRTPTSSADSLATLLHPGPGRVLTLVKDQSWLSWAMLHAMEMNQASISVITVYGLIIAAVRKRLQGLLVEKDLVQQWIHLVSLFCYYLKIGEPIESRCP